MCVCLGIQSSQQFICNDFVSSPTVQKNVQNNDISHYDIFNILEC